MYNCCQIIRLYKILNQPMAFFTNFINIYRQMSTQSNSLSGFDSVIKSINQNVCTVCEKSAEVRTNIQNSEAAKMYRQYSQSFLEQIVDPFRLWYYRVPRTLTNMKFETISQYDYNVRFNIVNGLAVMTALSTYKSATSYTIMQSSLRAIKNAGLVYLISGLLIAPEIYNPLMHQ